MPCLIRSHKWLTMNAGAWCTSRCSGTLPSGLGCYICSSAWCGRRRLSTKKSKNAATTRPTRAARRCVPFTQRAQPSSFPSSLHAPLQPSLHAVDPPCTPCPLGRTSFPAALTVPFVLNCTPHPSVLHSSTATTLHLRVRADRFVPWADSSVSALQAPRWRRARR